MSSTTTGPVNATIVRLALQALAGRRRFWLLLAFPAALLALAALLAALTGGDEAAWAVVTGVGFPLLLPLVAITATSSVLGPEIDDGSIVHLLAKPVDRHTVAASKFLVAWSATMLLGALPLLGAGLVVDPGDPGRAVAWAVGGAVAGTAYTALFLALSSLTRHAVVVGLLFTLFWEGLLGGLLTGVARLSIGQWGQRVAGALDGADPDAFGIGTTYALVAAVVVTVAGLWFTGDRLRSFTLRGDE
jgi:ABC-2 type transport system permease protein